MVKRNAQNITKILAGESGYAPRRERRQHVKFKTSNKNTVVKKTANDNVYITHKGIDHKGRRLRLVPAVLIGNTNTKAARKI